MVNVDTNLITDVYQSTDLATVDSTWPIEIMSKLCTTTTPACGAGCCTYCEPTCGVCTKPAVAAISCPPSNNCSSCYTFKECCTQTNISSDCCPQTPGACTNPVCDLPSGKCQSVSFCPPLNAQQACFNYTCVPGSNPSGPGVCNAKPLFADDV